MSEVLSQVPCEVESEEIAPHDDVSEEILTEEVASEEAVSEETASDEQLASEEIGSDEAEEGVYESAPESDSELPSESEPEAALQVRKTSRSRNAVDESSLCQFPYADGRQCRMLRHQSHPSLCIFHAQEERQYLDLDFVADELASISGTFCTQTDINHVLGRLFHLVAAGRIPARRAENLTYLGQLLLQSQAGIKYESDTANGYNNWIRLLRAAYPRQQRS